MGIQKTLPLGHLRVNMCCNNKKNRENHNTFSNDKGGDQETFLINRGEVMIFSNNEKRG